MFYLPLVIFATGHADGYYLAECGILQNRIGIMHGPIDGVIFYAVEVEFVILFAYDYLIVFVNFYKFVFVAFVFNQNGIKMSRHVLQQ